MSVNAGEETKGFSELVFDVAENDHEINTLRVFGEKLLHIELGTGYGKKEFVCAQGEGILNCVMLKPFGETDCGAKRLSVFASYGIKDGVIEITLRDSIEPRIQHWSIDPVAGKLEIALDKSGFCIAFALIQRENNG